MSLDHLPEVRKFVNRLHQKVKSDAKTRRHLEFTVTVDELVELYLKQAGQCALTGWPLEWHSGGNYRGGKNPRVLTMDRIDSQSGYVIGNIQLTCLQANILKAAMSQQDFVDFCRAVAWRDALKPCYNRDSTIFGE